MTLAAAARIELAFISHAMPIKLLFMDEKLRKIPMVSANI